MHVQLCALYTYMYSRMYNYTYPCLPGVLNFQLPACTLHSAKVTRTAYRGPSGPTERVVKIWSIMTQILADISSVLVRCSHLPRRTRGVQRRRCVCVCVSQNTTKN